VSLSPPSEASLPPAPLDGIRVLDAGLLYAAPLIATLLADQGAEVYTAEPPSGDRYRASGPMWALVGRNKRSITLDLTSDRGCDLFRALVAHLDVVIENLPIAPPHSDAWPLTTGDGSSRRWSSFRRAVSDRMVRMPTGRERLGRRGLQRPDGTHGQSRRCATTAVGPAGRRAGGGFRRVRRGGGHRACIALAVGMCAA
jgi:CoA-transferase family III